MFLIGFNFLEESIIASETPYNTFFKKKIKTNQKHPKTPKTCLQLKQFQKMLSCNTTQQNYFFQGKKFWSAVSSSDGGEMICVDKNLCSAHLFVILWKQVPSYPPPQWTKIICKIFFSLQFIRCNQSLKMHVKRFFIHS